MSTNFLFRPINSISKSLRSVCNDDDEEEKRVVSSSSQVDEKPPQNNNGERTNGASPHASRVSPPLEESTAKLDNTAHKNPSNPPEMYNPTETDKPDDKRPGRPPRKKHRRTELDKLQTWNVRVGDGEIATARTCRGLEKKDDATLAVTPSPGKKRARRDNHVESRFGMDTESNDEAPRKRRARRNVDPPIRYADNDAMVESQLESRDLAPKKVVISTNKGDDEDDELFHAPQASTVPQER